MKKVRACKLCSEEALLYCASDFAFLCFRCDAKVRQANYLVAHHVRQVLCFKCEAFSDHQISDAGNDRLQQYYCLACLPKDEFGSDYNSSASPLDCVLSSESCTTSPKRVELEDWSEDEKKKKVAKRSISSSVMEVSGGGDNSVFPTKISMKKIPFFLFQASSRLHVFFFLLKFTLCWIPRKLGEKGKFKCFNTCASGNIKIKWVRWVGYN